MVVTVHVFRSWVGLPIFLEGVVFLENEGDHDLQYSEIREVRIERLS